VTNQWLKSSGHCSQIFGSSTFMGVGYYYNANSRYRHFWTQNFMAGPALPTQDIVAGTHDTITGTNRFLVQVHMAQAPSKVSVVVGGTSRTMALLMGTARSGTYFVDIGTLSGADSDGCVQYYFEVNSGASRMPADKSYHFLTFGVNNCKRNIGKGGAAPVRTTPEPTTPPAPPVRTTAERTRPPARTTPAAPTPAGTIPDGTGGSDGDGGGRDEGGITANPAASGVSQVDLITSIVGLCAALHTFLMQ
jgi:hypothetical protein